MGSKGTNIPMGPNGSCSQLIYHDDTIYEGWIDFRFIPMHKGILVTMQGCIWDNEQGL